jgi:hypothetical protein
VSENLPVDVIIGRSFPKFMELCIRKAILGKLSISIFLCTRGRSYSHNSDEQDVADEEGWAYQKMISQLWIYLWKIIRRSWLKVVQSGEMQRRPKEPIRTAQSTKCIRLS